MTEWSAVALLTSTHTHTHTDINTQAHTHADVRYDFLCGGGSRFIWNVGEEIGGLTIPLTHTHSHTHTQSQTHTHTHTPTHFVYIPCLCLSSGRHTVTTIPDMHTHTRRRNPPTHADRHTSWECSVLFTNRISILQLYELELHIGLAQRH